MKKSFKAISHQSSLPLRRGKCCYNFCCYCTFCHVFDVFFCTDKVSPFYVCIAFSCKWFILFKYEITKLTVLTRMNRKCYITRCSFGKKFSSKWIFIEVFFSRFFSFDLNSLIWIYLRSLVDLIFLAFLKKVQVV
jgi:hypothetical protein